MEAPKRIPGQRKLLNEYEVARLITERIQELELGSEPNPDVKFDKSITRTVDIVYEEYKNYRIHSKDSCTQLIRTFPNGAKDVVQCKDGQWTITRIEGSVEYPPTYFYPDPEPEFVKYYDPSK